MTRTSAARLGAVFLATAALAPVLPAHAQATADCAPASSDADAPKASGFGRFLKNAAGSAMRGVATVAASGGSVSNALDHAGRRTAERAATGAVDCAMTAATATAHASVPSDGGVSSPAATGGAAARASKPARSQAPRYPSEIAKPAGFDAIEDAFDAFGKGDCMECEGGYAYDSWPVFPRDEYSGKYNGDAQRLGSWPVGHVHTWKGNVSTGTLTVVDERTVEGFRCRTLHYRLTKGTATAERPGLLCWGRANQYAGSESWNEVY